MADAVHIQGLRELSRAFRLARTGISSDLRAALQSAAEPVRSDAEALAVTSIRRIGIPWSRMRTGVTSRMVYVAPRERGVKSRTDRRRRRPNLATLLQERAMDPAFAQNRERVIAEAEDALNDLARAWSRV